MEAKKGDWKRGKRGLVLPLIAVIALCLAILGVGILQMGFGSRLMATRTMAGVSARAAADAGITRAHYELNQLFTMGDNPLLTPMPQPVSNEILNNSNAIYSYKVRGPFTELEEPYWVIESIGKLGTQQKTVYAILSVRNLFDYGLIVTDSLDTAEGSMIDGYNSDLGRYGVDGNAGGLVRIGTTYAGDDFRIQLKNNVIVTGDVLVGIGGNVDSIIRAYGTPGPTTGPWYNLPEPFEFETITVPDCGPNLGTLNEPNYTIGELGKVTYRKYDNIIIPNSGILDILGTVYIHVTGDITLRNGAEIRVNGVPMEELTWSSVTIYLNRDLNVNQGGLINNRTEKPQNFKLFGIGTSASGESWIINNRGIYYGVYYGPNATIDIRQSAVFLGSISGKAFIMRQAGQMHYDVDLSDLWQYDTGFGIDRLWEKSDFILAGL